MGDKINSFSVDYEGDMIILGGALNEYMDLSKIKVPSGVIKMDLAGVNFINSIGTGYWVRFWANFQKREVEFYRVSIELMSALAMMTTILPKGKTLSMIKSFYIQSCCMNCSHNFRALCKPGQLSFENSNAYTELAQCPVCGNPATATDEFNEFLDLYADEHELGDQIYGAD